MPEIRKPVLNRNPITFETAVEYAILDEFNGQFSGGNDAINNTHKTEKPQTMDKQLKEFLEKQAEMSNHLLDTLSNQLQHFDPAVNQRLYQRNNKWPTI